MRSTEERPPDERSTKARIRDAAVGVFAAQGTAGTTARAVAEAAGVSPGLVIHHFDSMDGLRRACDEHIVERIRARKSDAMTQGTDLDVLGALRDAEYAPLTAYVARMLVEESPASDELVDHLVTDAEVYLEQGVEAGTLRPSADPRARARLLTLWSLGGLVLHRHMERLLGVDLTAPDVGTDPDIANYARPALELLGTGIFTDEFLARVQQAFTEQETP
ncbi:MAG: TetR family transcriptional regulator [Acidimicrobiia bacterium]